MAPISNHKLKNKYRYEKNRPRHRMVCFTYRRITGSIRRKSLDAGRMYALRDRKQPRSQETAIHQCQLPPGLHLGRGPNDAVGQRQRRRFVEFRPFAGPCDQYLCLECQFQQLVRSRRFDRSIRRIHRDQQSSIDQGRPPAGRGRAAKGFRRPYRSASWRTIFWWSTTKASSACPRNNWRKAD